MLLVLYRKGLGLSGGGFRLWGQGFGISPEGCRSLRVGVWHENAISKAEGQHLGRTAGSVLSRDGTRNPPVDSPH